MEGLCLEVGLAGVVVGRVGAREVFRYGLGSGEDEFLGQDHVLAVVG